MMSQDTKVPVSRTVGQITGLLTQAGARSISQNFDADGNVESLVFCLFLGPPPGMPINFVMPANPDGVARVTGRPMDQSRRIAWRVVYYWVKSQLSMIEAGQAEEAQVFLPYATPDGERTLYDAIRPALLEGSLAKLLPAPQSKVLEMGGTSK